MCPLKSNFFRELGKIHSSEIRLAIQRKWRLKKRDVQPVLRHRLIQDGWIQVEGSQTKEWEGAFYLAGEWNRYNGVGADRVQFHREVEQGKWHIQKGIMQLDIPTWLTLASLSFQHDAEKESPNHLFLKELARLYLHRMHGEQVMQIKDEFYLYLFGEQVRCDITCIIDSQDNSRVNTIMGEMGGVQLWKVMALLHKGYAVLVIPHWTKQKVNPFIRMRLGYAYYLFHPC